MTLHPADPRGEHVKSMTVRQLIALLLELNRFNPNYELVPSAATKNLAIFSRVPGVEIRYIGQIDFLTNKIDFVDSEDVDIVYPLDPLPPDDSSRLIAEIPPDHEEG